LGTHLQLYSSCLLSSIDSSSDGTNWDSLGSSWVWKWVSLTSGGEITKGSWGGGEFVELSIEEPLESVSLLISDPSLVVLVEVVPCGFEMGIEVTWDFSWLKLVSGLKGGTGSDFSIILHEELLTGLVSRWGSTFFGVMAIDVIHDFIFVGSIVTRDVHVFPGVFIDVSAEWIRIVLNGKLDGANRAEKCYYSNEFGIHIFLFVY
jgi:hypothetical protein